MHAIFILDTLLIKTVSSFFLAPPPNLIFMHYITQWLEWTLFIYVHLYMFTPKHSEPCLPHFSHYNRFVAGYSGAGRQAGSRGLQFSDH